MSEALPGMPEPPGAPPPIDASAVVLFRLGDRGAEVFWLKREKRLRFAGGFYAFPGGRSDDADAQVPVRGASGLDAKLIVSAARELLEETGVLKARGAEHVSQMDLDAMRRALLEETTPFGELLAAHRCALDAADFPAAGRWVTPEFMFRRFDARFFLVEMPTGQVAEVWPGELSEGEWIRPAAALLRWEAGTALLHPPNLHAVRTIGLWSSHAEALRTLRNPLHVDDFIAKRLQFQRGIHLVPLRTPTLPPATHTNCALLGTGELLVVDPGSPDDAEVDALVALLQGLRDDGYTPKAVVLTHHHGDHTGGLTRLLAKLPLEVWAHPLTADRLPVKTTRLLHDGDVLEVDGPVPMRWKVLHTPGHARGHVCLVDEQSRAAVVGDMVAGIGTIVIDPPEGDMAAYLGQLERMKALPVGTLYPAHGPVIPDGPAKLEEYLTHRAWREAKVVDALRELGETTVEALVPKAYDDVLSFVLPIAERSTQAIVDKLVREGRAVRTGEKVKLA